MGNQSNNVDAKNLVIAYLGGGSLGWANVLVTDLAMEEQLSGTVRLYDIDYESACLNAKIGNMVTARADSKGKWEYIATKTIGEALTGADFIVASILPGTFKEMHSDVHTPEKYGVYQSVGDTVGPGGLIRSLRTVPMYEEFALNIKKYAPDAWVINYTNPMTVCMRTLYKVFPEIKAFGCCHEVFGLQKSVASMLSDYRGIKNVERDEINVNVLGLNHFTWVDKMSYKDMDLIPLFAEVAEKCNDSGYLGKGEENANSVFRDNNLVKFDLYKRYGLIGAAGDRHLAEFMPPRYLLNKETAESFGFALTTVDWRIGDRKKVVERRMAIVNGKENLSLTMTGEEGTKMIKALLGLGDFVSNVNLPNNMQMDGIPKGTVVETNALFSKDSVRPLYAGGLPDDVQNLTIRHVYNQECIVEAGLTKNRQLAFNAFVNDPQMSKADYEDAKKLFDEMIENTKKYIPGW